MELSEFYGALLPPTGEFCLFDKATKRHHWFSSQSALVKATQGVASRQPDWYYATAGFDGQKFRRQANCVAKKALYLDIDAGPEKLATHGADVVYGTTKEAAQALAGFAKATGLVPSIVVASGSGLHAYWELDEPVTPDEWKPLAVALGALGAQHGLKIDPQCTTDSVRVLRPPGALHSNGSRVQAKRMRGAYRVAELRERLTPAPKGVNAPPRQRLAVTSDALPLTDGGAIPQGKRNETLFKLAARYRGEGLELPDILAKLKEDNQRCDEPVPDEELATIACSATRYPASSVARESPNGKEQLPPGFPSLPKGFSVQWNEDVPMLCVFSRDEGEDTATVKPLISGGLFYLTEWRAPGANMHTEDMEAYSEFRYRVAPGVWHTGALPSSLFADPGALARYLAKHNIHLVNAGVKSTTVLRRYVMALHEALTRRADSIAARSAFGFQAQGDGRAAFVHGTYAVTQKGFRRAVVGKALQHIADGFAIPCLRGLEANEAGYYADEDIIPRLADAAKGLALGFKAAYPDEEHAPYRFAAMMAMAAPLMLFFGDHAPDTTLETLPGAGFGMNLFSQASGRGKSALQILCAYAMAHPRALTVSGAIGMGGTSVTAVTSTLKTLNSYPLMCDEITNSDPEALSALYYSLSLGTEKRRASQVGGLLESGRWATVALSSSNISIRDVLSSVRRTGAAEQLRFMELNLDTVAGAENMGDDPTFIQTIIGRHFQGNRGAIPLLLANYAVRNMEQVTAAALKLQTQVAQKFNLATKERFYGRALAAALLTQKILATYGIEMFTGKDLLLGFSKALADSREHIDAAVLTGKELFQESLRALSGGILRTDVWGDVRAGQAASILNHNVQRPITGRYLAETGELLIAASAVRQWCVDNRVSLRDWKQGAFECTEPAAHLLGKQGKGNLTKGIVGEVPLQVHCYAYKLTANNTPFQQLYQPGANAQQGDSDA